MTWEISLESFAMRYNTYNKSYADFLKSSQPSICYRGFLDAIARVKVTQNCDLHVCLLADCPQLKIKIMEFKIPFQAQIRFFPLSWLIAFVTLCLLLLVSRKASL